MKWFGFGAGREGSRPALSRGTSAFAHGEWPQGYEAQVRAGYLGNAIAQRAVKLVADGIGGAPLDASDPALIALAGGRASGQRVTAAIAAQVMLHGRRWRCWTSRCSRQWPRSA